MDYRISLITSSTIHFPSNSWLMHILSIIRIWVKNWNIITISTTQKMFQHTKQRKKTEKHMTGDVVKTMAVYAQLINFKRDKMMSWCFKNLHKKKSFIDEIAMDFVVTCWVGQRHHKVEKKKWNVFVLSWRSVSDIHPQSLFRWSIKVNASISFCKECSYLYATGKSCDRFCCNILENFNFTVNSRLASVRES